MEVVRELHTISLLFTYCPSNAIFNDTKPAVAKRLKMRAVMEKLMTKSWMLRVMYEKETEEFEKNIQLVDFSCPLVTNASHVVQLLFRRELGLPSPSST